MLIFRGTCGFLGNSSEGNCLCRECDVSSWERTPPKINMEPGNGGFQ